MLKQFLGLFVLTFMICIFILLMQFVWMHVKDLVGKGVGIGVLSEFFVYAVISVVPLALPLAILLASLMTFGNLGEKVELTAMKAAGVSLFRIMRPLIIAVATISVGAFFFSNYVLPRSQVKLWTLIFSLRQKSPELDIPEGEFYDGIHGINIYVRHKDKQTGALKDMMIYDLSKGFNNATVMVADSGRVFFSEDNKYLLLVLYSGESFENLNQKQQNATKTRERVPYRRESFKEKHMLIDFDTEFSRYDESILHDQHVSKNVRQLVHSIDSVDDVAHKRSREQSEQLIEGKYFGRDRKEGLILDEVTADNAQAIKDGEFNPDSLLASLNVALHRRSLVIAIDKARQMRDQIDYNAMLLDDSQRYIRKHEMELHRKFTLAFACLIFFFIGAPLGAIIRKGGLGVPVVISVVMFVIYYIIDNTGYKMAREGLWPVWAGLWLSSAVLLPIGIFLTYKAATDSALFRPEVWYKYLEKITPYWTKLVNIIKNKLKLVKLSKKT